MLSSTLKILRSKAQLTQKEVASKIGVSRVTYTHYELGKREPDNETIKKLADCFNVSTDALLGRNLEPFSQELETPADTLSSDALYDIRQKAEKIKDSLMASVSLAFDNTTDDEDLLLKIMTTLEESVLLAKEEATVKYSPKSKKD